MSLLTQEEHKAFVEDLGFKKVSSRCPVCYVEKHIEKRVKEAINKILEGAPTLKEDLFDELGLEDEE